MQFYRRKFNQRIIFAKRTIYASVALAIVIAILLGVYFYNRSKQSNVQTNPQEEVKMLVKEVGKLVDLPTGEDPTVATVTDISRLKDQPFFARAKNGDKVLIYTNAKKAYLYDPKAKKVIDVAPINLGSPSAEVATPSATPR